MEDCVTTHTQAAAFTAVIMVATLVSGCGTEMARGPVTPTPTSAPTPASSSSAMRYSVSGVVFEVTAAGDIPVKGVEVYCDPCGPFGHSARFTDADGRYSFAGEEGSVAAGTIPLLLAKEGYKLPHQPDQSGPSRLSWMGSVAVVVSGDTRHDIHITRK
jgi:hypothetical protein